MVFHATNTLAKSKGVSILICKSEFKVSQHLADPEGRFLFVKVKIQNILITLVNVYFPNSAHISFRHKVIEELRGFSMGCILLGSDFNVPSDPLQAASNGKSSVTFRVLKRLKSLLSSLTLLYTWRMIHPCGKDFYSTPHNKYSCMFLFPKETSLS